MRISAMAWQKVITILPADDEHAIINALKLVPMEDELRVEPRP